MGSALGDVRLNGGNQLRDTAKHAATNLCGRQVAKDPFDQIEPRTTGRGEMHVDARVTCEPSLNRGMGMCGIMVRDQVEGLALRNLAINQTKEPQPFLMSMAW